MADRPRWDEMAGPYDAAAGERRWYPRWLERGYFHADPASGKEPFCIVLPPPNVTGVLHMGHALDHTLQDVLVRRARMQGKEALWLPGTDHASIAVHVLLERELKAEGTTRFDLGRERFLERAWAWTDRYGSRIVEQMKALGSSCDWDRLRFTMDDGLSRAVRVAFVRMYDDGLIYRGERIINWCPKDLTALSDSEVEHEDVEGELITFRYPLSDGSAYIDVATTRIETMLGDTGIAVHPDDDRYRDMVGRTVRHPFRGEDLPIVADPAVDPDFGTGAVKVTPAHDPTDFEIAERAGLPRINILDADGSVSDAAPEEFRGLDRYEARKRVAERLRQLGWLVAEQRPYVHAVGHCYRCGSELEPWLSGKQWFVAVERLKGPAREAADDGRIGFHPARWKAPYVDWLDNLRDWNISRQLWWGHRIPVWYCENGHDFAATEDPSECARCGSAAIDQDPDVLDTWFSSQLWPFSTLGWPDDTPELDRFYPTEVLVTGYEILYLWVARMIMSGLYLAGDVPFGKVLIHGLVRDSEGRKMSKSLGNVIDPLDLVERYGADALRFALARMATGAQDIPFGEEAVEAGRNFANKIWNAARLVLPAHAGGEPKLPVDEELTLTERWILSRHEACREDVDRALEAYRFADAARALHRFLWAELCDWALEFEKEALHSAADGDPGAAPRVLAWVLERTMRLLHPLMPFVSEEIWSRFGAGESIVIASWPEPHPEHRDPSADDRFAQVRSIVTGTRQARALVGMPAGARLLIEGIEDGLLDGLREPLERLTGATLATSVDPGEARSLPLAVPGAEVSLVLPASFDAGPALERRRKTLADVKTKLAASEAKLGNESFVSRAAAQAVEKERVKRDDLTEQVSALSEQMRLLEQLDGA